MRSFRRNPRRLLRSATISLVLTVFCGFGGLSLAQTAESFSSAVTHLPDYLPDPAKAERNMRLLTAVEQATDAEKQAAIPILLRWANDPRPEVRSFALGYIGLTYIAAQPRNGDTRLSLPAEDVQLIAPRLLDESGDVRNKAVIALSSAVYTDAGRAQLQRVIVPMLRDGKVLEKFPDPFFIRSNAFILAHTPSRDRAAVEQMQKQQKMILLPAVGPQMLGLVLAPTLPKKVENALIFFLDRDDQTAGTLSDCLHTIALSRAPEPIQNEAVTRVFQKNAMSVFLLQFLNNLSLTPEHLRVQRERLVHLASDGSATPQVQHAASTVAACWTGDRHQMCQPAAADFRQEARPVGKP